MNSLFVNVAHEKYSVITFPNMNYKSINNSN
jgi:hypothetical protein